MKIDLIDIDNALAYYQINDINYKNKCLLLGKKKRMERNIKWTSL